MNRRDDKAGASGEAGSRWRRWVARAGVAGVVFFLVKGLAWLVVPALIVAWTAQGE